MRRSFQLLVFFRNYATGIMAPVLTLALLAHGASISTVSLLLGVYSFTVIVAEFPSGVFADLWGRKVSLLLSTALFFLCYCLILFSQSMAVLLCAMVANGLGRAFSTGCIEALAIDDAAKNDDTLIRITARLSILESAGLATGALAGGLLSGLGMWYVGNLGANLAIYLLMFLLTSICVHEQSHVQAKDDEKRESERKGIGTQVKESLTFITQRDIRTLIMLSLITGFALFSIETYWQPALSSYSPAPWVFGAVSFAGFSCVAVGSRLVEHLLTRRPNCGISLLLGSKALFGGCLMLLASRFHELFFVMVYMLMYLFLGGSSVAQSTLLNRAAPASQRVSILSMFSFMLQIGGLIASLCGYVVSAQLNFRIMWLIAGVLLLLCVGAFILISAKRRHRQNSIV